MEIEGAGHRADKFLDAGVLTSVLGHPLAETQHFDAVCHVQHLGHVVTDQDHRNAAFGDLSHEPQYVSGLANAQGGRGLVEE